MRCGERKHRGWQDSNGEAETEERESKSEGEGWNMGCCQPAESERVLGWRGLRAGKGDTARIRWVPGRWQCREKKTQWMEGDGTGRGDADGLRRAESKGVPLVGLPRPGSATLPGAGAHLTSRSSGSSPGRSPRCPLPAQPLPSRPLQHLSLPATALGQRLARARPRAASASPAVCVRAPELLPAYEELGPGPRSTKGCSGAQSAQRAKDQVAEPEAGNPFFPLDLGCSFRRVALSIVGPGARTVAGLSCK